MYHGAIPCVRDRRGLPLASSMLSAARALLSTRFGLPDFRPLQAQVILHVLQGHDVLAVLPTGGGKSLCYQVPALLAPGPTLVVSPLIALMQDQVGRLESCGIPALMLGGELDSSALHEAARLLKVGRVRLAYLSPERLASFATLLVEGGGSVNRIAVDEAHCIVEWGHDFRPAYRRIAAVRQMLGHPPVTALTGTATVAVRESIKESLGLERNAPSVVGSFDRPNLRFRVEAVRNEPERLARLLWHVRSSRETVIVYAPTRNLVEGLTHALRRESVLASAYHAGLTPSERRECLEGFLGDRIRVVVATSAFGMGIDKADVRLVVHWSAPPSPEAYYQEAGRAGRDGEPSDCLLLHHPRDMEMPLRQLEVTYPDERLVEAAWRMPVHRARCPVSVRASVDRLADELRPDRGPVDWSGVRKRRREAERRIRAMGEYGTVARCRRATLLEWFGEPGVRCAGCDWCASGKNSLMPLSRVASWGARISRRRGKD